MHRSYQTKINRFIGILIIFGIGILLILVFIPNFTTLFDLNKKLEASKQKVILAQKQNKHFKEELNSLQNDPNWIEKVAREKLGWVNPDETVYRFPSNNNN